jgi:hypothetical protein
MYGISMGGQNHTKFRLPYNSHRYGKYMGQLNVDYHIIPIDMESIWVHMRSILGQPSVDYHIIPIDMESIWDNQMWTTI